MENWTEYLHSIRRREFRLLCRFVRGRVLELGAGDGYQSSLLARRCTTVIATDYRRDFTFTAKNVHFLVCDSEQLPVKEKFDTIYASNLLEHVPDPVGLLRNARQVLNKEGLIVVVVPNLWWKLCHVLLYVPAWITVYTRVLRAKHGWRVLWNKFHDWRRECLAESKEIRQENNAKTTQKRHPVKNIAVPPPHGVSRSTVAEFGAFARDADATPYIDGEPDTRLDISHFASTPLDNLMFALGIDGWTDPSWYEGLPDEVRVMRGPVRADWIRLCYETRRP